MKTPQIPKHNLSDKFQGEMIVLWQIHEHNNRRSIDYAHRDDYYMFMFLEQGYAKVAIDFEEYELQGPVVVFILPEQVHLLIESENTEGWGMIVDRMLVDTHYREIFQSASIKDGFGYNDSRINDLKACLSILDRRINCEKKSGSQELIYSLLSSYIGIVAEMYQKESGNEATKRPAIITSQFRALLSSNYKTMKKPSQYADAISISPVYLNEVIKKTMGITANAAIHNEVIVQAKRLLFYTDLTVKEVALELGYEDWAYFTRLFTKTTTLTPTQFRAKYLK